MSQQEQFIMTTPAILYDSIPAQVISAGKGERDNDVEPTAPPLYPVVVGVAVEYETILDDPNDTDYVVLQGDEVDEARAAAHADQHHRQQQQQQQQMPGDHTAAGQGATSDRQNPVMKFIAKRSNTISRFIQHKAISAWRAGQDALKDTTYRLHEDVLEPTAFGVSQTAAWLSDTFASQISSGTLNQSSSRLSFQQRLVTVGEPLVCNVALEEPDESDESTSGQLIVPLPPPLLSPSATVPLPRPLMPSAEGGAPAAIADLVPIPAYEIETDADVFDYHIVDMEDLDRDAPMHDVRPNHSMRQKFFDLTNHQPEAFARILFHAAATGGFLMFDSTKEQSYRAYIASKGIYASTQRKWATLRETSPLVAEASSRVERGYHWISRPLLSMLPLSPTSDDANEHGDAESKAIELSTNARANGGVGKKSVSHEIKLTQ